MRIITVGELAILAADIQAMWIEGEDNSIHVQLKGDTELKSAYDNEESAKSAMSRAIIDWNRALL